MRVEFLGTGGYHPNERRHTAGVLLPEVGVLFDAGTGLFRLPSRLETRELHIFLSHAHLDHIAGLTFLLAPMLQGDIKSVGIHATQPVLQAVREHLFAQPVFPVHPDFEYLELEPESPIPGGGVIRHVPLEHPGGSTGYRIDHAPGSLAYFTDTTVGGSRLHLDFLRGVDLLIHECYFPDELADWAARTGHSHTTAVAELARDAGVGRLVLVHVDPSRPDDDPIGLDTARAIFPATEIAEDLMQIEF